MPREKVDKTLEALRVQLIQQIESLKLRPAILESLLEQIKEVALQAEQAERILQNCCGRLGLSENNASVALRRMLKNPQRLQAAQRKANCSEETLGRIKETATEAYVTVRTIEESGGLGFSLISQTDACGHQACRGKNE